MSEVVETMVPAPEQVAVDNGAAAAPAEATPAAEESELQVRLKDLLRQGNNVRKAQEELKKEVAATPALDAAALKADPLKALAQLGISAEDLVDRLLARSPEPAEAPTAAPEKPSAAEERIAQLEAKLAAREREEELGHIRNFQKETLSVLDDSGDDAYEMIKAHPQGKERYWDLVSKYVIHYGEVPDRKAIAQEVENQLMDEAKKLLAVKKLAGLTKPVAESTPAPVESAPAKEVPPTLSSKLTPQTSVASSVKTSSVGGLTQPAVSQYAQSRRDSEHEFTSKIAALLNKGR